MNNAFVPPPADPQVASQSKGQLKCMLNSPPSSSSSSSKGSHPVSRSGHFLSSRGRRHHNSPSHQECRTRTGYPFRRIHLFHRRHSS
ncbi:hypothetical protein SEUCBS139899_007680 [Sporothrix eucalyptigena]